MDYKKIDDCIEKIINDLKIKNISKEEWEFINRNITQQYELECSKITLKNLTTSK